MFSRTVERAQQAEAQPWWVRFVQVDHVYDICVQRPPWRLRGRAFFVSPWGVMLRVYVLGGSSYVAKLSAEVMCTAVAIPVEPDP